MDWDQNLQQPLQKSPIFPLNPSKVLLDVRFGFVFWPDLQMRQGSLTMDTLQNAWIIFWFHSPADTGGGGVMTKPCKGNAVCAW